MYDVPIRRTPRRLATATVESVPCLCLRGAVSSLHCCSSVSAVVTGPLFPQFHVFRPLPCGRYSPCFSRAVIGPFRPLSYGHLSAISGIRPCGHVSPISAITVRSLFTCFRPSGHRTISAVVILRSISSGFSYCHAADFQQSSNLTVIDSLP